MNFLNRRIKLSAISLSFCVIALAAPKTHAGFGVKAGYGVSVPSIEVLGVAVPGLTSKGGFLAGLTYEIGMGPLSVFVDALYAQRILGFTGASQTFNYLELPVMANLTLGFLRINGGAYYAMSLGKIKTCLGATCQSHEYNVSFLEFGDSDVTYKKGDYGVVAGIGLTVPTPGISVSMDLRYRMGFQDISNVAGVSTKWKGFDVIAGVVF
jgi:hypothetical protein